MKSPSLSFWEKTSLIGQPDLVVIGSGIVGINAALAYNEKYPEARILIIERGVFSTGASTRNAGFACFGSLSEILSDLKVHEEQEVIDLLQKRWNGLDRLMNLVGANNLNLQITGSYEYFDEKDEESFNSCVGKLERINALLKEAFGVDNIFSLADGLIPSMGLNTAHLIKNKEEGTIDTGKMMWHLQRLAHQKGIQFFNGLNVEEMERLSSKVILRLSNGWEIETAKCVVATNGFATKLLPELEVKPARNLVLITEPIPDLKFNACFHGDEGYYYFRNVGNRVLLGGGRNLAIAEETTSEFGENPLIKVALINKLKTLILPNQKVNIEQWWSGILGVGEKKFPILRRIDERVVVAARLGGMGVAIGSELGKEAIDLLDL